MLHETEWFRPKVGAKYSGVSERTFRDWLKNGLRHSKLHSGSILIKREWLDEFLMQFENTENRVGDLVEEVLEGLK